MKKTLIALAAFAMMSAASLVRSRSRTHDVSFGYRMGAGFAGDVNRTHPASIYPAAVNVTNPPRSYGVPVLFNAGDNTIRGLIAADASDSTAVKIDGVVVRPYPVQSGSPAGAFGQQLLSDSVSVPTNVPQDYLQGGRIMVKVRGAGTTGLNINSPVFIFCTADEANHVQGGFETTAIAGKTVPVSNAKFRGPTDANGIGELEVWI